MSNYFTILKAGTFELMIKKSRFICQIMPVTDEAAALTFINSVKKSHPKANHHCYAYQIGPNFEIQRQSDDGEPSGTAGVPILNVLKKRQLTNCCVVITRYFGGIKLGTGGLIRAYGQTTSEGISAIGIGQMRQQSYYQITLNYPDLDRFQYFLKQQNLIIDQIDYGQAIKLKLWLDDALLSNSLAAIDAQLKNQAPIELLDQQLHLVEITP